jgi:hypothetical protein
MASVNPVKKLRGTAAQNAAATLAEGVVVYLTDTKKLRVHDGTTAGGVPVGDSSAASESAAGIVELATTAEAVTGTDTDRAVTPAGVKAVLDAKILTGSKTWDPPSVALGSSTSTTVTVTGATVGMAVRAGHTQINDMYNYSLTDTVTVYLNNGSGSNPKDFASGTLKVWVFE